MTKHFEELQELSEEGIAMTDQLDEKASEFVEEVASYAMAEVQDLSQMDAKYKEVKELSKKLNRLSKKYRKLVEKFESTEEVAGKGTEGLTNGEDENG